MLSARQRIFFLGVTVIMSLASSGYTQLGKAEQAGSPSNTTIGKAASPDDEETTLNSFPLLQDLVRAISRHGKSSSMHRNLLDFLKEAQIEVPARLDFEATIRVLENSLNPGLLLPGDSFLFQNYARYRCHKINKLRADSEGATVLYHASFVGEFCRLKARYTYTQHEEVSAEETQKLVPIRFDPINDTLFRRGSFVYYGGHSFEVLGFIGEAAMLRCWDNGEGAYPDCCAHVAADQYSLKPQMVEQESEREHIYLDRYKIKTLN